MTSTPASRELHQTPSSQEQDLADLHNRLHLNDVRVQRLRAEAIQDPPLDVKTIVISVDPGEVLLEPPRFAARFTQTVTLRDKDEQPLAEVEIVMIVDFGLDDGPIPTQEAINLYAEHNAYFIAHPYLRETLQNATLKLGIEPVVLGILSRSEARPSEVTLVKRVTPEN
ncbi:hypothetical protein [Streptomyces sp. NRRL F-5630]|uniref:hypothetical protein n=1 Tax=Streptomyces sp. NRRL F-5630 TaxID=1463864 RepID=UPI003EB902AD